MEATIKRLKEDEIQFINFQFTTINGSIRQLINPAKNLESLLKDGLAFDGSSCGYVPVNQSDLCLIPDLSTYRVLPWGRPENKTASFICDVYSGDGTVPFESDPRGMLKRMIAQMKEEFGADWELMLAPEIEFFLLDKDENGNYIPADRGSYFEIPPYDQGCEFRKDISRALDSVGINTEKNHHEVPPGKHEITFEYSDALAVADMTMVYRQVVKQLAAQKGLTACFMAKPFDWTYGCGMHVHLSLQDAAQKSNLFYDEAKPDFLSDTARHFIAGLIDHAQGLAGITNPTINSYKRLVPGWEAPVYVSWGFGNRSSLLRIPNGNPKARRVETRNPDSSCNPYLAFGAILSAGLDGLRRKAAPPEPYNGNIYDLTPEEKKAHGIGNLPAGLKEALDAFEADEVLCKAFGPAFTDTYLALKRKDVAQFAATVHPWELKTYVNI